MLRTHTTAAIPALLAETECDRLIVCPGLVIAAMLWTAFTWADRIRPISGSRGKPGFVERIFWI